MAEVQARGAKIEVRTVSVTKPLLKQCRQFRGDPGEPFRRPSKPEDQVMEIDPEYAIGWFRGTVLGEEYDDFVLFAKDGDLYLLKIHRMIARAKLPPTCKQIYIQ